MTYPTYSIIHTLKRMSKRTEKITLLKNNVSNEELKRVFNLTLNPNFNFGIQHIDNVVGSRCEIPLCVALDFLEFKLNTREVTGNQARQELREILQKLCKIDQDLVLDILNRNLDCGVSISTVNKVWPGLLPTCEFMLASVDTSNLQFPAICQVKYDGMRVQCAKVNGSIILTTRNNTTIRCPKHLATELDLLFSESEFLDGELLVISSNQDTLDRQTGNGILNKLIKGTISPQDITDIHFVVWDVVDNNNNFGYQKRLHILENRLNKNSFNYVRCAEGTVVSTFNQLTNYFEQQLTLGFEGIVAKNLNSCWQPKRSKDWVKFKDVKTADLKVTKIIPGSGKYTGKLGALELSSSDGKVIVSVGTGFSDAQRELLNHPRVLNQIVEVAYNSRITSKNKVDSLYLPRFIRFRSNEKTVADNSEEIQ